jgi:hypothetical protein
MSSRHFVILRIRAVQLWAAVFSSAYLLVLLGTCFTANHVPRLSAKAYQMTQVLLFGRFGAALADAQLAFWIVTSLALGILHLMGRAETKPAQLMVHQGGKKQPSQAAQATVLRFKSKKRP